MPLIASSIWLFLTGLGVLAAMHTEMPMHKGMQADFHVHSPPLLTKYTIIVSLSGMAMRLTLHVFAMRLQAMTVVSAQWKSVTAS